MRTPDCINCLCKNYRDLFSSDDAMAEMLRISPDEARQLVSGEAFPTLDAMVNIQSALRKVALVLERKKERLLP